LYSTSPTCVYLFQASFTTYVHGHKSRAPSKVLRVLVSQIYNGIDAHLQYFIPVFVKHMFILSLPPHQLFVFLTDTSPWLLICKLIHLPTHIFTFILAN